MQLSLYLTLILLSPNLAPVGSGNGHQNTLPHLPASAEVTYHQGTRTASLITRLDLAMPGASLRAKARAFLDGFRELTGGASLTYHARRDGRKQRVLEFRQIHEGLVVLDRSAVVTFNERGNIQSFNSDAQPVKYRNVSRIDEAQAAQLVNQALEKRYGAHWRSSKTFAFKTALVGTGAMVTDVYELSLSTIPLVEHLRIRVDANGGQILSIRNTVIH